MADVISSRAPAQAANDNAAVLSDCAAECLYPRLDSRDLFRDTRQIEIAHAGRIYRLRLTQLNKLILTA